MPDGSDSLLLRVRSSLGELDAAQWDACAGSANPFLSYAFLSALEDSGSANEKNGWLGQHLCLESEDGQLLGAVPLYLKNHSYGEYVFDWGWAEAYERAGGRYYPKLQSSVPFTPVTGPRLLIRPGTDQETARDALISGLIEVTKRHKVSSLHVTFCEEEEWQALGEAGFLQRIGLQYHWRNEGYGSFEDFLGALTSRKRKWMKKERRKVAEAGIEIRPLSGQEITEDLWDAFYHFYLNTADKRWGQAYLTREFFSLLGERMGAQIVLMTAFYNNQPVAAALKRSLRLSAR